jgi:hypothetical protein
MKKSLKEELHRIHEITYGNKIINESFIDNILNKIGVKSDVDKSTDDPKKADFVSPDVSDFFKTIEDAANSGGLKQQSSGEMGYQKSVESMQIGLTLLGYQLPKYGIDGLFGPETGEVVQKFTSDHLNKLNEDANKLRTTLDTLGYTEKGSEITSGGNITNEISTIVSNILNDFKKSNPNVKVTITSGNDNFHKRLGYKSKHTEGNAIDITLNPHNTESSNDFTTILNKYKSKDSKFSFIDEYKTPSSASTGGHFHLQYGGTSSSTSTDISASPEMLNKLIELLRARGVKPEELKSFIDIQISGEGFTDLDLNTNEGYETYIEICDAFISKNTPNPLGITGEMMARGAKGAFDKYKKYVAPELALSQLVLEGGIKNGNLNSRPIRTKNPFNVGNVDTGENIFHNDVQLGINAYYDLIAKNYLGKGRSAKDLLTNFVNKSGNRYATAPNYERILNKLAMDVNRVATPIISKNTGTETMV